MAAEAVHAGAMRLFAVIAFVSCASHASVELPAVVVEPIGSEHAGFAPETEMCAKPPAALPVELLVSHGMELCEGAPCTWPLAVAVHNPNPVPIFVVETHALDAQRSARLAVAYDPPIVVPPGASIAMPRRPPVGAHSAHHLRVFYLDGWGRELFAESPIERGQPLPVRTTRAELSCTLRPPPELAPLVLDVNRGCAGCGEVSVVLDNPNPHRMRIVDFWIENPDGTTTAPARSDRAIHYVEAQAHSSVPYRIAFDRTGRHLLKIGCQDGWGRLHEARTLVDVP